MLDVIAVGGDVLASDVANEFLVAIIVTIEDEAGLAPLCAVPEALRAKEQAELERHIKAWQTVRIQVRPRDVVDAPTAIPNDPGNLLDADLARVIDLPSGLNHTSSRR